MGNLFGGDWATEVIPLRLLTAMRSKECQILSRLHSFRDDPQVEALAHADNCNGNGRIVRILTELVYKRPVDFQCIERKLFKITQAGVTRSEVIDRYDDPSVPELP